MLTLIWREIVDHAAHLLLAALLSAIMIGILVFALYDVPGDERWEALIGVIWVLPFALFGFCFMGTGQMYADRAGRISSFLSTLAVTRAQILLARILVGLLAILIALVPVGIASVIVLQKSFPPLMFYSHWLARVYAIVFLTAVANYSLGLQIGSCARKTVLIFGGLFLPSTVMALVVIKGFAGDTIVALSVLVAASVVSVTLKFRSTPL